MSFLTILLVSLQSFSQVWKVETNQTDHPLYPGANCVAWTESATITVGRRTRDLGQGIVRLEVLANEVGNRFKQPIVQIRVKDGGRIPAGALTLVANGNGGKKLELNRVAFEQLEGHSVFLGKLDERQLLIQSIKDLGRLEVQLKSKTRTLGKLSFSLRGSSRSVSRQFADCGLGFQTHSPIE